MREQTQCVSIPNPGPTTWPAMSAPPALAGPRRSRRWPENGTETIEVFSQGWQWALTSEERCAFILRACSACGSGDDAFQWDQPSLLPLLLDQDPTRVIFHLHSTFPCPSLIRLLGISHRGRPVGSAFAARGGVHSRRGGASARSTRRGLLLAPL